MMIIICISMMTMRFTHISHVTIDIRIAWMTKKCIHFMIVLEGGEKKKFIDSEKNLFSYIC